VWPWPSSEAYASHRAAFASSDFVTSICFHNGVVRPTPNPQKSWRTNVFCQGCLP
jgi:hypothetical protein